MGPTQFSRIFYSNYGRRAFIHELLNIFYIAKFYIFYVQVYYDEVVFLPSVVAKISCLGD